MGEDGCGIVWTVLCRPLIWSTCQKGGIKQFENGSKESAATFAHSGGVLEGRQAGGSDTFISMGCLLPALVLLCGQSKPCKFEATAPVTTPSTGTGSSTKVPRGRATCIKGKYHWEVGLSCCFLSFRKLVYSMLVEWVLSRVPGQEQGSLHKVTLY